MRFMVIVKATKESEAGEMPSEQLLTEMGNYNEELVKAGIMKAGEGLHPSSKGKRVRFSGKQRTVIDGPFPETKELIAGYWIWETKSLHEAVEWVKKCPNPMPGESEIEIRQIFEAEDFGAEFTPELREQEERLRREMEGKTYFQLPKRPTPKKTPNSQKNQRPKNSWELGVGIFWELTTVRTLSGTQSGRPAAPAPGSRRRRWWAGGSSDSASPGRRRRSAAADRGPASPGRSSTG